MKLTYWRGDVPNFGDELNPWLWSRLLPNFFDDDESTLFVGIGSILYDDYPHTARKIVFGSGYGGYTAPPVIDERWTVYCVRGPRTAKTLCIEPALGVGDAAALVCTLPEVKCLPRGNAGAAFMPHWESAIDGRWERAARAADMRYIDPRWDVERVMREIAASDVLVTEAMHGAIGADALRVPFVPFAPLGRHRAKWLDWADALDLTIEFAPAAPSSLPEATLRITERVPRVQARLRRSARLRRLPALEPLFVPLAAAALRRARVRRPHLSSEAAWSACIEAMLANLERVRRDFRPRVPTVSGLDDDGTPAPRVRR